VEEVEVHFHLQLVLAVQVEVVQVTHIIMLVATAQQILVEAVVVVTLAEVQAVLV
jgi:hypothetical protein